MKFNEVVRNVHMLLLKVRFRRFAASWNFTRFSSWSFSLMPHIVILSIKAKVSSSSSLDIKLSTDLRKQATPFVNPNAMQVNWCKPPSVSSAV